MLGTPNTDGLEVKRGRLEAAAIGARYGDTTVLDEALSEVEGDLHFFYTAEEDDNIVETSLADNPLWQGLPWVEADHVYYLGVDAWYYGGPLSVQTFLTRVTDHLTGEG